MEERLTKLTTPDIRADIHEVNVAPAAGISDPVEKPGPNDSLITLIVRVKSLAMPSIADEWTLATKLPNGSVVKARKWAVPRTLTLRDAQGRLQKTLYGEDALYDKTVRVPMATGSILYGVLVFYANQSSEALMNQGTTLILEWKDINGKIGHFEMPMRQLPETGIRNYPGMHPF